MSAVARWVEMVSVGRRSCSGSAARDTEFLCPGNVRSAACPGSKRCSDSAVDKFLRQAFSDRCGPVWADSLESVVSDRSSGRTLVCHCQYLDLGRVSLFGEKIEGGVECRRICILSFSLKSSSSWLAW